MTFFAALATFNTNVIRGSVSAMTIGKNPRPVASMTYEMIPPRAMLKRGRTPLICQYLDSRSSSNPAPPPPTSTMASTLQRQKNQDRPISVLGLDIQTFKSLAEGSCNIPPGSNRFRFCRCSLESDKVSLLFCSYLSLVELFYEDSSHVARDSSG